MRSQYDEQLAELNRQLITMGALCEEAITLAARALTERDTGIAEGVAPIEEQIGQLERSIEASCLRLILRQQPVATDLRQISAALKMITDMERIGDQAADIAEIIRFLDGPSTSHCAEILEMAQAASRMVTQSIDAYVNRDTALAGQVIDYDDVVDGHFSQVKRALIKWIADEPEKGEYALDLLMIDKYFERIGDHAANIAKWVLFSVTGTHKEEIT